MEAGARTRKAPDGILKAPRAPSTRPLVASLAAPCALTPLFPLFPCLTPCSQSLFEPKTPTQLREWLTEHMVDYNSNAPTQYLETLYKRKKRRIDNESLTPTAKKALFDMEKCHTVETLMREMNTTRDNGVRGQVWSEMKGQLEMLPPELTRLKHNMVGGKDVCRGNVEDGTCKKCKMDVMGVIGYGFDTSIKSLTSTKTCAIKVAEGGGVSLFKMSGADFAALSEEEKMDLIESVEGEAFTIKLQYIANEGDSVIIPHSFTIIPPTLAWPSVVATKQL